MTWLLVLANFSLILFRLCEQAMLREFRFTPSPDDRSVPPTTCSPNSQCTPEMRSTETRKRQLRKTYEELFPDSGLSDVRCSSPVPGNQPPSPTFGSFAMKELANYSPFANCTDNNLHSPSFGSPPGTQFGPTNDMVNKMLFVDSSQSVVVVLVVLREFQCET